MVGPPAAAVHASGYAELARVDIVRDGRIVHTVGGKPPLPPGHRRVDVRVEWGQADTTTRWDGRLTVAGGTLVLPDYVGPEVVAMDERAVEWQHVTHSFGEPYGAQRGGVEVSVCGPDDARLDSCAAAGRSGSGWASWPPVSPSARSWPTATGRACCSCSPPSGHCSGWAPARSTWPSPTTNRSTPRLLLRAGVPGGRRAGLVVADLGGSPVAAGHVAPRRAVSDGSSPNRSWYCRANRLGW